MAAYASLAALEAAPIERPTPRVWPRRRSQLTLSSLSRVSHRLLFDVDWPATVWLPSGSRRRTTSSPIWMLRPVGRSRHAVRHQDHGGPVPVRRDRVLISAYDARRRSAVERALQHLPGLRCPKARRAVSATGTAGSIAPRRPRSRVAGTPRRSAGLCPARGVEVALSRAVVEPGVRRIEPTGGEAVAQHHDAAGRAQRVPNRFRSVRDGGHAGAQDNSREPSS